MSFKDWRAEMEIYRYQYDFAKLGGAVSAIELSKVEKELPLKFVVNEVYLVVETTITSGGTPTLVIGDGSDDDNYFANFFGTPTAGAAVKGGGAGVSGGVKIIGATLNKLVLTIGTAAVTAGKFSVYVRGFQAN